MVYGGSVKSWNVSSRASMERALTNLREAIVRARVGKRDGEREVETCNNGMEQ